MSNITTIQSDSVIVSLTRASAALMEAKTIQHTKKIVDVAAAAEIYVRRQNLGVEAEKLAASVKVEALRKLGEMLKAAPKNKGAKGSAVANRNRAQVKDETPTLTDLGINKKTSAVAQKLAELPVAEFEQVREGNETMAKALARAGKPKKQKETAAAAVSEPAKPPLSVVQPPRKDEYTDLDAARDQVEDLQDALVVANMGVISEEDKGQAATLIQDMRGRIKMLDAMLRAVKASRDTYQAENAQLRIQIDRQRREIDRVTGRRTA